MNSREEAYRLVWTFLGAIMGVGVGLSGMLMLFNRVPSLNSATGLVPMLVVIGCCGGGLIGGGYLALYIVTRYQRRGRKRYFDEKKKQRKKKRK